jgi:hypothetical protein
MVLLRLHLAPKVPNSPGALSCALAEWPKAADISSFADISNSMLNAGAWFKLQFRLATPTLAATTISLYHPRIKVLTLLPSMPSSTLSIVSTIVSISLLKTFLSFQHFWDPMHRPFSSRAGKGIIWAIPYKQITLWQ